MMIELNKPLEPDLKKLTAYLAKVNESGWYTNFGPLHEQLTARLEGFLGVKNLLLVSNGTLALQVAYKALNINSAITTPFSFVATTSSLLWQGIETAFSDIDPLSYNLCPKSLESSLAADEHYDGIVATHVYGNPCSVADIENVAKKYDKKIIYDAAHAFGVSIGERSVLNFGDASTLSFHATKLFHTVEGGAIIFKHKTDFDKARQLINFGMQANGSLGEPGINAKLNEYQCAVGLTLLDDIENVIDHRSELFSIYRKELDGFVDMPLWGEESSMNGAYMPIYVGGHQNQQIILDTLRQKSIQYRRYFSPSLDQVFKEQKSFGCPISQKISGGVICLPLHKYMNKEDVLLVSRAVKEAL